MKNKQDKKDILKEEKFSEQKEKETETENGKNKKKKSSEKKEITKLKEKIKELERQIEDLKDSLLRKAAEFENYKRRTENDQMNLLKYAAEGFIAKILPIYDDLERSLKHFDETGNSTAIKDGLQLVFKNFTKVLNEQGVKRIEAKGKPFDFNLHEALMQQPSADFPPHTVLEEIEPGYIYKDKVIKHSKVIVSQEVTTDETTENGSGERKE